MKNKKPLNRPAYGSIPHLPQSRLGPSDSHCELGQARIATEFADKRYEVIVTEKYDGSCCSVAKLDDGRVVALTRAGYLATDSPHIQHHAFALWVAQHYAQFDQLLQRGERVVGEWLLQVHTTRYNLSGLEPFVIFDMYMRDQRIAWSVIEQRCAGFVTATVLHRGGACSVDQAMALLGEYGHYGAITSVEGAVWRVEFRKPHPRTPVAFVVKYVRPGKIDGEQLDAVQFNHGAWDTFKDFDRVRFDDLAPQSGAVEES